MRGGAWGWMHYSAHYSRASGKEWGLQDSGQCGMSVETVTAIALAAVSLVMCQEG